MTCSFPPELTDEQMMSVLDGESDAVIRQHLTHCASCRARFEGLYQFEILLRRKLRRRDCPKSSVLGDYALDLLPAAEHQSVDNHVQQCPRCRAEVDGMYAFLRVEDPIPAPMIARPARRARPNERYARVSQGPAVLPLRGSSIPETLLLETDGVMIFLEAQPEPDGVMLMGRLLTPELAPWANALVEVKQNDGTQIATIVDESGVFSCHLKSTTAIRLWVTSQAGITLVIENIQFET